MGYMSVTIDPQFSIYDLVCRSRQASITLNNVRNMQLMSHKIEDRILNEQLNGFLVVGFQYFSRFYTRLETYQQLGKSGNQAYVLGYPDVEPPDIEHVTFVPLKQSDLLIKDWFVIFHSPEYYTALIAKEVPHDNGERKYNALWTFDLDIIKISCDWLASQLDVKIFADDEYDHMKHGEIMDDLLDEYLETDD